MVLRYACTFVGSLKKHTLLKMVFIVFILRIHVVKVNQYDTIFIG